MSFIFFLIVVIIILIIFYGIITNMSVYRYTIPLKVEYHIAYPSQWNETLDEYQLNPAKVDILYHSVDTNNFEDRRIINSYISLLRCPNKGRHITIINDFDSEDIESRVFINTSKYSSNLPIILRNKNYITLAIYNNKYRVIDSNIDIKGDKIEGFEYRYLVNF